MGRYLQESGTPDTYLLEDGSGVYLTEGSDVDLPAGIIGSDATRGASRAASLGTWAHTSAVLLYAAAAAVPFVAPQWIVPRAAASPVALRTFTQGPSLALTTAPFVSKPLSLPSAASRPIGLRTWVQGKTQDVAASPFVVSPSAMPRGAVSPIGQRTFSQSPSLALTYVAPTPPDTDNLPAGVIGSATPYGPQRAVGLRTWIQGKTAEPEGVTDYLPSGVIGSSEPPGARRDISLRTFTSVPGLLPVPEYILRAPLIGAQRANARSAGLRTWTSSTIGLLGTVVQAPFKNTEWPNPRGATRANQGWTQNALSAKPFVNSDWPLPRSANRSADLRTWVQSPYVPAAVVQAPFSQQDWTNPRGASRSAITWTQSPAIPAAVVQSPFSQTDWSNPRGVSRSALTWTQSLAAFLQVPFKPQEWSNPRQASRAALTWTQSPYVPAPVAAPFTPIDWPNPKKAGRSASLLTYGTEFRLAVQPPPVAPPRENYDWPNPRGARQPVRDWALSSPVSLLTAPPVVVVPPETPPFSGIVGTGGGSIGVGGRAQRIRELRERLAKKAQVRKVEKPLPILRPLFEVADGLDLPPLSLPDFSSLGQITPDDDEAILALLLADDPADDDEAILSLLLSDDE